MNLVIVRAPLLALVLGVNPGVGLETGSKLGLALDLPEPVEGARVQIFVGRLVGSNLSHSRRVNRVALVLEGALPQTSVSARLVLLLAGLGAGIGQLGLGELPALGGLSVVVELVRVGIKVLFLVVARDDRQGYIAQRLAGEALLADVGGRRRADGRGRSRGRGGSARNGLGDGGRRRVGLASVAAALLAVAEAALEAAELDALAVLDVLEAAPGVLEAGAVEARRAAQKTSLGGVQALKLVVPLRDRRCAPVTNLAFALGRDDGSGDADRRGSQARGRRLGGSRSNLGGDGGLSAAGGRRRSGLSRLSGSLSSLSGSLSSLSRSLSRLSGSWGSLSRLGSGRRRSNSRAAAAADGRLRVARLGRQQALGEVDVQALATTAVLRLITTAGNVALRLVRLRAVLGQEGTTVAFTAKLGSGIGEALSLAGRDTLGGGESCGINLDGPGEGAAVAIVSVAALGSIAALGNVLSGESRVLIDGEGTISTTCL